MKIEYRYKTPTVYNRGDYRVGRKAHKVWIVNGIEFLQKRHAIIFQDEFIPANPNANPEHFEGAFETWLIVVGYGLLKNDHALAMEYLKLVETVKYW